MTHTEPLKENENKSFVCFGASAGGLKPYLHIFSLLPSDTSFVFIVIHHQPSNWKTLLLDIIPGFTSMPVKLVEDGEIAEANCIYIGPPGQQVTMTDSKFRLSPLIKNRGWPQTISNFLRSLASSQTKNTIAVILSGLDSDGAAALKSIKDAGGIVIVQDFHTAEQPAMPINAVDTGCVDFLLSPKEIA